MNVSMLPTEVLSFERPEPARLELISCDPRMEAQVVARGTLTLLAYVPDEGPFDAFLAFKVDGNFVSVALHKEMLKDDIFFALSDALPPGYEAATSDTQSEVLIVTVLPKRARVSST